MKRAEKQSNQAGFTLMELLIAITLLGLVMGSFAYLYGTSQRFLIQSLNITSTQTEAAFALEHIRRNLQLATAVTLPVTNPAGRALEFTWQPTVNAVATPPRTSRYQMNGTDLEFVADTDNGAAVPVARGITQITFTQSAAATYAIEVRAQRTSGGDTRQITLRTTVSPRGLF